MIVLRLVASNKENVVKVPEIYYVGTFFIDNLRLINMEDEFKYHDSNLERKVAKLDEFIKSSRPSVLRRQKYHTCCKRHQNVELQFITVQAMQEDEDGNALTTVKPDVAAVLRAKREIQPGDFIRYQYTDQPEHLKKIFECERCFHVGLCQPHRQKSMLQRLAAAPK